MAFFNKISGYLRHKDDTDIDSEMTLRGQMLSFTLISLIVFNLIFSLIHLIFYEISDGLFLLGVFILLSATYFYYRNKKKYTLSFVFTIIWMTIILTFLIFKGIGNFSGIMWSLGYPVLFAFLTDYKKSGFLTLLFLAFNIGILILSNQISSTAAYSTDIIIRFTSVYLLLFLFVQFFMRIRQQAFSIKEKKIFDAQQKVNEKNRFLSDLSYKLRTPLNTITGILNVQRDNLSEDTVEEIELSLSNLISIINSIPEVFEKRITPIKGKETFFDLSSTVRKSVKLFQSDKYERLKINLNLSNKINDKLFGDRLLFIQIIISLIDYLYKNIEKDLLKLDIITKYKEADETGGINLKIKCKSKHVFSENNEAISSMQDSKEILLIRDLVKIANADLRIENTEEETSFIFTFNYSSQKEVSDEEKTEEKPLENHNTFFKENKKIELEDANILLVEDDVMNSKVLTLNLSKVVNKIILAENGKEALEKYASTKIDLILMDIRMPLMDGFKTTEKIREAEIGTNSQTPIIAVTANASSEVKRKCYKVGMNDFTTKPINFKLLIKKMQDLLN